MSPHKSVNFGVGAPKHPIHVRMLTICGTTPASPKVASALCDMCAVHVHQCLPGFHVHKAFSQIRLQLSCCSCTMRGCQGINEEEGCSTVHETPREIARRMRRQTLLTTQFASETHCNSVLPNGFPCDLPVLPRAKNTHVEHGVPLQRSAPMRRRSTSCTAFSMPAVVRRSMLQFLQMSYCADLKPARTNALESSP